MGNFDDKELNLNDGNLNKVAGGRLDIVERNGAYRVIKEYDNEFKNKEDAQTWLYKKAEKCLDKECGLGHCHGPGCPPKGPGEPGMMPPPPKHH